MLRTKKAYKYLAEAGNGNPGISVESNVKMHQATDPVSAAFNISSLTKEKSRLNQIKVFELC